MADFPPPPGLARALSDEGRKLLLRSLSDEGTEGPILPNATSTLPPPPPEQKEEEAASATPPPTVTDSSVRVCVRLRPATTSDTCASVNPSDKSVKVSHPSGGELEFPLHGVFDQRNSQGDVAKFAVSPAVQFVLDGINAAVMCYGQTGSVVFALSINLTHFDIESQAVLSFLVY